jgi:hypothetical protein
VDAPFHDLQDEATPVAIECCAANDRVRPKKVYPLVMVRQGFEILLRDKAIVCVLDRRIFMPRAASVGVPEVKQRVWPADRLKILSIGTINDVRAQPKWKGKLPMATSVTRLFMAGQSHSAMGAAMIITGDGHDHRAIWRVDQTAPEGRYTLDNASRIAEMKDRATTEARQQLPELRRAFFQKIAEPFVPFHSL